MHVFGVWKEAGAPGGNQRIHGETMQIPQRKALAQPGIEPSTFLVWGDSATTTVPPINI